MRRAFSVVNVMNSKAAWRDVLGLLVWMAVVFGWSTGAGSSGHTNSWVDALLARLFPHWSARLTWPERDAIHFYLRKAAHVTEYAILAVLAVRALRHSPRLLPVLPFAAWLFCTLYAATDEYHQAFVPGRTAKPADALIDSAGAAVGIALVTLRNRRARAGNKPLRVEP